MVMTSADVLELELALFALRAPRPPEPQETAKKAIIRVKKKKTATQIVFEALNKFIIGFFATSNDTANLQA
jgi:hypothetical protein